MIRGLLIVAGNNTATVGNIIWVLDQALAGRIRIEKVLILDVADADQRVDISRFHEVIPRALGRKPQLRHQEVEGELQTTLPSILIDAVNEVGREGVVVDLTSGTKACSAVLYACASFSQLPHLYYVNVHRSPDRTFPQLWTSSLAENAGRYELIQLPPLKDVQALAAQSYFDLIFYVDRLDKIDGAAPPRLRQTILQATQQLRTALPLFFRNPPDYLSAMRAIGTAGESIQLLLPDVVAMIDPHLAPCLRGSIGNWGRQYREAIRGGTARPEFAAIGGTLVIDSQVYLLKNWRNAAAHKSPPAFGISEVRTAMHAALNLLETILAAAGVNTG
jgi:hypothetical protein